MFGLCLRLSSPAVLSAVLLSSISPALARASDLYSNEYAGPTPLFSVNQATGLATAIGPTGSDNIGDLTSDQGPTTPRLWGVKINTNSLLRLDPATGATINTVQLNSPNSMVSIAFNQTTGRLYGNTSVGFGAPFDALYEIDPNTGNSTFIGRITFDNVYALGFNQAGTLYGISDATDQLITINTGNGNGSLVANMVAGGYYDIASRPEDDVMFVVNSVGGITGTVNVGTGVVTPVGPYVNSINLVGLAFIVPEPASLGAVAVASILLRRRRRS